MFLQKNTTFGARALGVLAVLGLAVLLAGAGSASAARHGVQSHPRTIIVKFDRTAKAKFSVVKLRSGESMAAALATYRSMANVAYAEPNVVEHAQTMSPPN